MAWVLALGLLSALAGAVDPADLSAGKLITVYGEAEEGVAPDFVVVRLSVQAQKASADESFATVGETMSALLAALKSAGLSAPDVQTMGPTASRLFRPGVPASSPASTVRAVAIVTLHALDRLSDVVRAAQTSGAEVESLHYDTTGRKAREDVLRAAAVEDARRRAEVYAEALGLKLGQAHSLIEDGANPALAMMHNPMQKAMLENATADAGAVVLREGVFISFDLAPK